MRRAAPPPGVPETAGPQSARTALRRWREGAASRIRGSRLLTFRGLTPRHGWTQLEISRAFEAASWEAHFVRAWADEGPHHLPSSSSSPLLLLILLLLRPPSSLPSRPLILPPPGGPPPSPTGPLGREWFSTPPLPSNPLLPLRGGVYHCSLLINTPSPRRPGANQDP